MTFAFVFPGQGSQAVGMLDGYGAHPVIQQTLHLASEVLGEDVERLIAEGPAERLNQTVNTQPVMVVAGVCAYRLWCALEGPPPVLVAGHSLGEYTALVAAGALSLEACLPLVRFRAEAMQEAVPMGTGAMAAVLGLEDDAVRAACAEGAQGEVVEAVNFNAPAQVVIAGHRGAVERAGESARARGAKRVVMLPVSAPFHSSLLAGAAARLRERLQGTPLAAPRIPVIHNVDVREHGAAEEIREALAAQADHPVRWAETMRAMAARGVTTIAECGPGKVLAPLVKRTLENVAGVALADRASIEKTIEMVGR